MIKKLDLDLPILVGADETRLSYFVRSQNIDKRTHKHGIT